MFRAAEEVGMLSIRDDRGRRQCDVSRPDHFFAGLLKQQPPCRRRSLSKRIEVSN